MSSIPNGGAAIPVTADLSAAYAQLNAFRSAASQPVSVPFTGASAATGATPFVGSTGFSPSTFGSPGATPFTQNPTLVALSGLQQASSGGIPGGFGAGSAYQIFQNSSASSGFGGSGGGASLSQSAAQMQSAAQTMLQAAQVIASGGGGGGSGLVDDEAGGGGGGGAGGGGGRRSRLLSTGRLTRFATAGFAVIEGIRLAEQYGQLQTQNELSDYKFGAGSVGASTAKFRSQYEFTKSIPLAGLFGLLPSFNGSGDNLQTAAAKKAQDVEDSEKFRSSQYDSYGQIDRAVTRTAATTRAAQALGIGPGDVRSQQGLRDQYINSVAQGKDAVADLRRRSLNTALSETDRGILRTQATNLENQNGAQNAAARSLLDAQIRELKINTGFAVRSNAVQAYADQIRGRGYETDRERQDVFAKETFIERDRIFHSQGLLAASAYTDRRRDEFNADSADISFNIKQRDAGTESNRFRLKDRPLDASLLDIRISRDKELRISKNEDDRTSINNNSAVESQLASRDFNRQTSIERLRINNDTQRLQTLNNLNVDPLTRRAQAAGQDIYNSALQDSIQATIQGRGSLVPNIISNAREQINNRQVNTLDSIKAEEVDPTRQSLNGAGTEDLNSILTSYKDALDKLPDIAKAVADLLKAVQLITGSN